MPDQLQVMNPAMVLLMIPVCPGGAWPILPDLEPLQKMFLGGILASLAFVSAGILQIGIEVILSYELIKLEVPMRSYSRLCID